MHILPVLLQHSGQHGAHYGPMGGAGGVVGGIHWGPLWVFLALVALVGVVYLVSQSVQDGGSTTSTDAQDDALAVLRRRYATGDIDDAEFEERRTRLSGTRHS